MEQNERLLQDRFSYNLDDSNLLGSGSFGTVYRGIDRQTNTEVAIKIIPKAKLREEYEQKALQKELEILKMCENPYSTRLIDTFDDQNYIYIIMELCDSDLGKELKQRENHFPIDLIKKILLQLNNVFLIMNKKKILHRDLKLDNIFIKYTNPEKTEFDVKLGDYGFSTVSQNNVAVSAVGTPLTQAPEILMAENYTNKVDLWSIGVITYQMYFGQPPFTARNRFMLIKLIKTSEPMYRPEEDPVFADLLDKLLKKAPEQRIEWKDYYNHPFFGNCSVKLNNNDLIDEKKNDIWMSVIQTSINNMEGENAKYDFKFEKDFHSLNKDLYICSKVKDIKTENTYITKKYTEKFVKQFNSIIQKEKELLKKINDNKIPSINYINEQSNNDGSITLIFNYIKGQTLKDYVSKTTINEEQMYKIISLLIQDIFLPIHKLGINLSIITLDSILIDNESGKLFLFDCGLHKNICTSEMIAEYFIYPEELNIQNEKSNVLNFGVSIFKAFFKSNPILSYASNQIIIPRGIEYTTGFKHFLSKALCNDPSKRADWFLLSNIYINVPLNIITKNKALITEPMLEHLFQNFQQKLIVIRKLIVNKNFQILNNQYSSHLCLFVFSVLADIYYAKKFFIDFYEEKENIISTINVFQINENNGGMQVECIDFNLIPLHKRICKKSVFNAIKFFSKKLEEIRQELFKIFKEIVSQAKLPYLQEKVPKLIIETFKYLLNYSMKEYIDKLMENTADYSLYLKYLLEFLISLSSFKYGSAEILKNTFYEINNMFMEGHCKSNILKVGDLNYVQKNNEIKYNNIFTSFLEPGFKKCKQETEYQKINLENNKLKNLSNKFIEYYRNIIPKLNTKTNNF